MSANNQTIHDFGTDKKRIHSRARKKAKQGRLPGTRPEPPVVVFEAAPGSAEASLPPVRIFLGTEPLQYRAERVFIYSVAKHRNPGRRYEIYLMKDLVGYDRSGWATGFSNYRFVIPALAGATGRAIYNDVDQMYLTDPAELFDRDMGEAALLAIDDSETSVLLMDCEKLAALWSQNDGQGAAKPGSAKSVHAAGLWGTMPGIWNARDTEYVAGESKVLHFTTLYKQPWQPFPEVYDYDVNENAAVWNDMEAEANAAHYLAFTRDTPSDQYRSLVASNRTDKTGTDPSQDHHTAPIAALIAQTGAKTLLDYGAGADAQHNGVEVTRHMPFAAVPEGQFDGVVSTNYLQRVTEEDVLWALDEMFRRARKFVYVSVACYPAPDKLPNGESVHCTVQPPEWWRGQMETISAMHPDIPWELNADPRPKESGLKGMLGSLFAAPKKYSNKA